MKVHYTGWTADGKMFDSSLTKGKPVSFSLDKVIAGWTEGVQLMVAGETRRFWIPESLAYHGAAGKPAGTLFFEVKLISFDRPPTEAPPDLKSPPPDARKTVSGLLQSRRDFEAASFSLGATGVFGADVLATAGSETSVEVSEAVFCSRI